MKNWGWIIFVTSVMIRNKNAVGQITTSGESASVGISGRLSVNPRDVVLPVPDAFNEGTMGSFDNMVNIPAVGETGSLGFGWTSQDGTDFGQRFDSGFNPGQQDFLFRQNNLDPADRALTFADPTQTPGGVSSSGNNPTGAQFQAMDPGRQFPGTGPFIGRGAPIAPGAFGSQWSFPNPSSPGIRSVSISDMSPSNSAPMMAPTGFQNPELPISMQQAEFQGESFSRIPVGQLLQSRGLPITPSVVRLPVGHIIPIVSFPRISRVSARDNMLPRTFLVSPFQGTPHATPISARIPTDFANTSHKLSKFSEEKTISIEHSGKYPTEKKVKITIKKKKLKEKKRKTRRRGSRLAKVLKAALFASLFG